MALFRQIKHLVAGCLLPVKGCLTVSSNLEHFCLLFGVEDALEHVSVVAGSDLPAAPLVSSDLYSICHVKEQVAPREIMSFPNDSPLTGQLFFF